MNELWKKFAAQEGALGTFFNVGDCACMECLGYTGLDFVIIDTEHGPYDTEHAMELIRTAEHAGLAPVVRIADVTHKEIQRAADCGAVGIIVPCLNTMEEFTKLVDLAKYPPLGNRGFIKGRGAGFGNLPWSGGTLEEYMAASNEKLMVIPQCETKASLEIIEQVAALEGVDGVFIGPFDLSISLGIPGQFDHPGFCAALERIQAAFRAAGKPVYIFVMTAADVKRRLAQGYDGVALNLTGNILIEAYRTMVDAIKQ